MEKDAKELLIGTWFGIAAYLVWGFLPIFWKTVEHVPSMEVLAHRIFWSLVFMLVVLFVSSKWQQVFAECKAVFASKKLLLGMILASLLISINWFTYIYAVNSEQIVETSLGYYINPLISVLLAILVMKEKFSFWQFVSFFLATVGVLILTFSYGSFPWLAFILALSFALYGLAKKLVNLGAITSLTIETLLVTPIALIYLYYLHSNGSGSFGTIDFKTTFFLLAAGAATATPLLLFASGARRIPLSLLGFLQYIAPTIQLMIGVFMYKEPFSSTHLLSFLFIWVALLIFTLARTRWMKQLEPNFVMGKKKDQVD